MGYTGAALDLLERYIEKYSGTDCAAIKAVAEAIATRTNAEKISAQHLRAARRTVLGLA